MKNVKMKTQVEKDGARPTSCSMERILSVAPTSKQDNKTRINEQDAVAAKPKLSSRRTQPALVDIANSRLHGSSRLAHQQKQSGSSRSRSSTLAEGMVAHTSMVRTRKMERKQNKCMQNAHKLTPGEGIVSRQSKTASCEDIDST